MLVDTMHALGEIGWITRIDRSERLKWVEYDYAEDRAERIQSLLASLSSE
jgi:hypothetical protein